MRRSKHNLSHHRLASFDMGQLVPVGLVEVLPGDTFRHSSSVLLRVASMANPVMHPMSVRMHHWFVPSRVAYNENKRESASNDSWEEFWNKSADSADIKSLAITNVSAGSLLNHLGIPALNSINMDINILPLIMYNMIYNQFYRDQELVTALDLDSNTTLQRVCWEKDYFSSCRTYPQYDSTTIEIPFSGATTAPVKGIALLNTENPTDGDPAAYYEYGGVAVSGWTGSQLTNAGVRIRTASAAASNSGPVIEADLSEADGGIDVNDLRRSLALQKFLEARSRFGARYRDYLRYIGVRPSDGRIEEPEYLGGGKQTVAVSEVLATAEGTNTDVGQMAGHGIAALRTRPYTKFFEEHGYVMSLISVRPKAMYQESMHRHWFRETRDDFWQKEYEQFGPQAVLDKEVYAAHGNETDIFGYQDRFREYREHPSYVSGLFSTTDDDWHMAREYGTSQSLNGTFVTCTPTDRIYNDASEPECRVQVQHRLVARRLVSRNAR